MGKRGSRRREAIKQQGKCKVQQVQQTGQRGTYKDEICGGSSRGGRKGGRAGSISRALGRRDGCGAGVDQCDGGRVLNMEEIWCEPQCCEVVRCEEGGVDNLIMI